MRNGSAIESLASDAIEGLAILAYEQDDDGMRWNKGMVLWLDAALEYWIMRHEMTRVHLRSIMVLDKEVVIGDYSEWDWTKGWTCDCLDD